ncbi:MAG: ankyrin repeat domain-containing protein [Gemmatimonadota bacterium]|mgnify:CR=1 FL=1
MKRSLLVVAALCVGSGAESQDTRSRTTLQLPKAPVVADAAMNGDLAAVRSLIAKGANVNQPQGDGMTALHWAAERGDAAMVGVLLSARASVKAATHIGEYTPLHVAAKTGNGSVVSALITAGSDATALTTSGASALHFAAAAGDSVSVAAIVGAKADVNAKEKEWAQTPLMFAASADRAAAVRVLLRGGASPTAQTSAMSIQEMTAAEQAAARKRNAVLVSFEPEKHTNDTAAAAPTPAPGMIIPPPDPAAPARPAPAPQPKGPFTPTQIQAAIDSGRATMLLAASAKGPAQEVVDTINGGVPGFGNSVGGIGGLTALHHAVRQGSKEAVKALLDGGAPINTMTPMDKTTPLLMATINGQYDIAMMLLKYAANPNMASVHGATPLYATINTEWRMRTRYPQPQAAEFQTTTYMELMEALLKAGANPNTRISTHLWYFAYNNCGSGNCGLENLEGTTAFWRAAYSVDVDAMKLLVKYGADYTLPSQRNPANVAQGGRGGAGGAGGRGGAGAAGGGGAAGAAAGAFAGIVMPGPPLDPAIDSASKAVPPGIGVYPIHAAAGVGYGNGFAGNSHRHKPEGWMPAMTYLIEELGADVNARDNNGMTPLHHAASRGDNEMILYLVSKGADVKVVSRRGQTVVDLANGPVQRLRPFPETIALLEKLGAKNSHRCVSC